MVRSLPKKHNPLILPDAVPPYEELLARRRLGMTNLAVKREQINTSNATKPENLGRFEYAHLRAPLPKDLKGSEIFPSHSAQQLPETYFLMRRSKDGYVSATGMFKIAFPWAKSDEEKAEREYLKGHEETSEDEIAGNVWVSPVLALELAKEYQMFDWVRALLDPVEIVQSPSNTKKSISITPPPKFQLPPLESLQELAPPASLRSRSRRSASPSKRIPSPRKSRQTRAMKEMSSAAISATNADLQTSLESTAKESEATNGTAEPRSKSKKETAAGETVLREEQVKVDVEIDIKATSDAPADTESAEGAVQVEMPSAAETEAMIAKAKAMVEEAADTQKAVTKTASSASKATKKRKQVETADDGPSDVPVQQVKRAKVLEEKLKQERVRNRALVGVTATLALAAAIPYFF